MRIAIKGEKLECPNKKDGQKKKKKNEEKNHGLYG